MKYKLKKKENNILKYTPNLWMNHPLTTQLPIRKQCWEQSLMNILNNYINQVTASRNDKSKNNGISWPGVYIMTNKVASYHAIRSVAKRKS